MYGEMDYIYRNNCSILTLKIIVKVLLRISYFVDINENCNLKPQQKCKEPRTPACSNLFLIK